MLQLGRGVSRRGVLRGVCIREVQRDLKASIRPRRKSPRSGVTEVRAFSLKLALQLGRGVSRRGVTGAEILPDADTGELQLGRGVSRRGVNPTRQT